MEPILCDSREPKEIPLLLAAAEVDFTVLTLHEADFVITDREGLTLGIERKTVNDFLSSISDGRLDSQLKRCNESYDTTMILREGKWEIKQGYVVTLTEKKGKERRRKSGWKVVSYWGKMYSIQTSCIVMDTPNMQGTVDLLIMLQKRLSTKGI